MARKFATTAKAAVGTLLAGSMLMTALPAAAQSRHRDHNDRIDAGDVIAGAVVIGGLAAILSASNNRDRRYDDRGYDPRYDRGDNRDYRGGHYQGGYDPRSDRDYGGYNRDGYGGQWRQYGSRQAVQQCVGAAEQRASYNGARADVRQITEVERVRGGYQVRGTIAVDDRYGRYDRYDRYDRRAGYDRDDRYDRRGYDDQGRFSCTVRYGQIQNIRVNGIG